MLITCPNCAAQYEIPDDLVPDTGRDVQCSDCQQTWFVAPPDPYLSPEDEAALTPAPAVTPQPARPQVSEETKAILQEEAARERAARQAEAETNMQVQGDLNLPAPERPSPGQPAPENPVMDGYGTEVVGDLPSRRAVLPDIEDINSSLSARTAPKGKTPDPAPEIPQNHQRKRGFRLGMVAAFGILATLVALYVKAPAITDAFPALSGPMNSYVIFVNDQRQWLFKTTETMIASITQANTTPMTKN